ncbi:hypothetical protein HQ531_06910 [bacterium]|nr:hypothetical protein [bacterium]
MVFQRSVNTIYKWIWLSTNRNLKLSVIVSLIGVSLILCSCNGNISHQDIPEIFQPFISQKTSAVAYKALTLRDGNKSVEIPDSITAMEALIDIEMLEYLISTSYSGFEYWKHRGVDFDAYLKSLRRFVAKNERLNTYDFENQIAKILSQISDGHISFIGTGYHMAYRHKAVYFSDLLVEKTDSDQYLVIDSQNDGVKKGAIFTQERKEEYLFKTLSAADKLQYFIGVFSYDMINSIDLAFDQKLVQVPLHKSRLMYARFEDPTPFFINRIDNIPVVRVTGFRDVLYPQMQSFMQAGETLQNEDVIIVNLFNNGGGSSVFPQTFIRNLNGAVQWETQWGELTSPAITEYYAGFDLSTQSDISPELKDLVLRYSDKFDDYRRTPVKNWQFSRTENKKTPGTYTGKFILLTNRRVLSAGENMVGSSQSIKNTIVIGENTGGVAQFSSTCEYYLPYSNLLLNLPRQLIFIPGLEECVGYLPDYWLDTREPVEEVLKWLKDPNAYQFKYTSSYKEMLKALDVSAVLPEDTKIVKPDSEIPDSLARYSGKWYGVSDGILDHLLVVEKIKSSKEVEAIYAWGVAYQWNIMEPGWERFKGEFEDERLVLRASGRNQTITYEINLDGSMTAIYERPGVRSFTEMSRID